MTTATVYDILEQAKEIHHRLSEHYQQLADRTERERLRMLLSYLQRHESMMEECVQEFENTAKEQVLHTWFQYVPDTDIQQQIQEAQFTANSEPGEIISAAIHLDQCLVKLYQRMANTANSDDVRHLFDELLKLEEKEEFKVIRDTIEMDDL